MSFTSVQMSSVAYVSSYQDCGTQEERSTDTRDRAPEALCTTICVELTNRQAEESITGLHTARNEDLYGVSYNVQRIRSRRRSCSELFDCLTELPRCDSILLDRCCSVINDQ